MEHSISNDALGISKAGIGQTLPLFSLYMYYNNSSRTEFQHTIGIYNHVRKVWNLWVMFLERRITATAVMMLKVCDVFAFIGTISLTQPEFGIITIYVQAQHASLKAELKL
jgi:hypothetical protein